MHDHIKVSNLPTDSLRVWLIRKILVLKVVIGYKSSLQKHNAILIGKHLTTIRRSLLFPFPGSM
jgi:hypothetical protein